MSKWSSPCCESVPLRRATQAFVACTCLCSLVGCSEESPIPVYPVTGVVRVQGNEADNAQVILHPLNPPAIDGLTTRPMASAGPDGAFAITTFTTGDGAPPGEYAVTIEWRARADGPFDSGTPDKLRGKYSDPATTPLRAIVEEKPNALPPFDLQ